MWGATEKGSGARMAGGGGTFAGTASCGAAMGEPEDGPGARPALPGLGAPPGTEPNGATENGTGASTVEGATVGSEAAGVPEEPWGSAPRLVGAAAPGKTSGVALGVPATDIPGRGPGAVCGAPAACARDGT
ncbi:hypothetical protein EBR96_10185 [bacterium]|nr:hypothetical protein [bacterium]